MKLNQPRTQNSKSKPETPSVEGLVDASVGERSPVGLRSHGAEVRSMTYGDGQAIKILAADRMGLSPERLEDAKRLLEGKAIHPIVFAEIEREATRVHNIFAEDPGLLDKANAHGMAIAEEYFGAPPILRDARLKAHLEGSRAAMEFSRRIGWEHDTDSFWANASEEQKAKARGYAETLPEDEARYGYWWRLGRTQDQASKN